MCTVTFVPSKKGFYLTSSRDEKSSRSTISPMKYHTKGLDLFYPKDELAGGTWIASDKNGRTACLLNGAFENHEKLSSYRKSRGTILLESFQFNDSIDFQNSIDLENIEPFTLLLLEYQSGFLDSFYELRWDGKEKYFRELSKDKFQIWSSATLYNSETRLNRESLYNNWLQKNEMFDDKLIVNFHNRKHGLKESEDILMKGSGNLRTLSISQIHLSDDNVVFNYHDIIKDTFHKIIIHSKKMINA